MQNLSLLIFLIISLSLTAQSDTTIFKNLKRIEANEYVFSVPEKWTVFSQIPNGPQLQRMEFTDVGLPHVVNNAPLTAICLFRKINCDTIAVADSAVIAEFTSYPDRITPPGYNYETDTITITSGELGILHKTHYYRRSKASNFTRYDMLVYSKKRKAAFWFTITYQYKDPNYFIEFDLKLKEYALRIYKTTLLR